MRSGGIPARSIAARAAAAPRSMAETGARAPPARPSPRLPPTHSAMGVRAPETMTISGSPLLDTGLLLGVEKVNQVVAMPKGFGCAAGRQGTKAPGEPQPVRGRQALARGGALFCFAK